MNSPAAEKPGPPPIDMASFRNTRERRDAQRNDTPANDSTTDQDVAAKVEAEMARKRAEAQARTATPSASVALEPPADADGPAPARRPSQSSGRTRPSSVSSPRPGAGSERGSGRPSRRPRLHAADEPRSWVTAMIPTEVMDEARVHMAKTRLKAPALLEEALAESAPKVQSESQMLRKRNTSRGMEKASWHLRSSMKEAIDKAADKKKMNRSAFITALLLAHLGLDSD